MKSNPRPLSALIACCACLSVTSGAWTSDADRDGGYDNLEVGIGADARSPVVDIGPPAGGEGPGSRIGGAAQANRPDASNGHYFVRLKAEVPHDEGIAAVRNLGARVTSSFPEVRAFAIRVAAEAAVRAIARHPRVAYVERMPMRYATGLEESQLAPALDNGLYGLITTRATEVHTLGVSGAGINVGVADTGLDYHHPDIAPHYQGGIDTIWHDNDPIWEMVWDEDWDWWVAETHGTHVAGTVLAANNSVGVLGVAYSANLYHARVLDPWGGTAETVMNGVRWLVETAGCKVVNLSLGGQLPSTTEENFYVEMRNRGVLIVCSAGNYGTSLVYPAAYPSTIAVGAVNVNNQHADLSNTGTGLDLSAPGVDVLSSVPPGWGFQEAWVQTTQTFAANPLDFAGTTSGITRPIINCAMGKTGEFPPSVSGNIALIQRGDITFVEKVTNAMNAGAVAAIIYNNVAGNFQGTLEGGLIEWIPVVSVSDTDGAILVSQAGSTGTVVYRFSAWNWYSGTSMAAPHVSGTLALIWSVNPLAPALAVENALFTTCMDLGTAGYDTTFGRGLVDAYAAVSAAQSAGPPPATPTGLTATGGHWQIALSWNASPGADTYAVRRAMSSGGPYQLVGQTAATSFIDAPLSSGTTFHYVVAAVNFGGTSANSAPASATTTGQPPPTGSTFQGLGGEESVAYAVSGDGSTAVGADWTMFGHEAFRWTGDDGMQFLGDLPGGALGSIAYAASASGSTLAGMGWSVSSGSNYEACRWVGGAIQGLGDLNGGSFASAAHGVSGDGSIIAGYGTSNQGRQAIRHTTSGGMQGLGDLNGGAFSSTAYGISSDGSTIVGFGTSGQGKQAIRWTSGGGMQSLGDLAGGAVESTAYAVSADGSVIVGYGTSAAGTEAFRWTSSGGMQALGDLPGGVVNSRALAVSSDGSIIVGTCTTDSGSAAFIWDAVNGMRNLRDVLAYDYGLNLTGWTLREARGLSADGRTVVGDGLNPTGRFEAWIAKLGTGAPCSTFVASDLDHDCDVDAEDLAVFLACASRADVAVIASCQLSDLDGDGDADMTDFGMLQRCYGGAGNPADPNCEN